MPIAKMRGATIKRVMSGFAGLALFIVVLNVTAFVIKYLWLGYLGQEGIKPSQETIHEARLLVVLAALLPAIAVSNFLYRLISKLLTQKAADGATAPCKETQDER